MLSGLLTDVLKWECILYTFHLKLGAVSGNCLCNTLHMVKFLSCREMFSFIWQCYKRSPFTTFNYQVNLGARMFYTEVLLLRMTHLSAAAMTNLGFVSFLLLLFWDFHYLCSTITNPLDKTFLFFTNTPRMRFNLRSVWRDIISTCTGLFGSVPI